MIRPPRLTGLPVVRLADRYCGDRQEAPPLAAVISVLEDHVRVIDRALRHSLLADVRGQPCTVDGEPAAVIKRADLAILAQIIGHLVERAGHAHA